MRCPHCLVDFHDKSETTYIGKDKAGHWDVRSVTCSACGLFVLFLQLGSDVVKNKYAQPIGVRSVSDRRMFHPRGASRQPVPSEVPSDIAEDYREACLVLADSPKASAALSRRCLQHLLRTVAAVKPSSLAAEIQEVLDSGRLPTHLAENIDAIRNVGNFSAHPLKSQSSGEIVPVEPHEATWNLDVLELLFDFYYVQPAAIAKKRAALNAKLAEAGKPPLK